MEVSNAILCIFNFIIISSHDKHFHTAGQKQLNIHHHSATEILHV